MRFNDPALLRTLLPRCARSYLSAHALASVHMLRKLKKMRYYRLDFFFFSLATHSLASLRTLLPPCAPLASLRMLLPRCARSEKENKSLCLTQS